jgi:hypothetical protein
MSRHSEFIREEAEVSDSWIRTKSVTDEGRVEEKTVVAQSEWSES